MSWLISKLLTFLSGGVLDKVLGHLEARANSETEQMKIRAAAIANANQMQASVIKEGMKHWAFWIPWLIVSVPASMWAGWGYMDSLFNGALPDVAALPPQLKEYADIVFANIFYTGAGMGAAQTIAAALRGRK